MPELDDLRATQSLPVLTPDDADYRDALKIWGPPASPDILVRPASPSELGAALQWAAAAGVDVAVRSGNHGPWAPMPGGLLIDLRAFDGVEVLNRPHVRVGAGQTWADVAAALAPHGLALSSGDAQSVGVGGNTLGAGVGWLVRLVGLAVDELRSAEVVTANGQVVTASETENPDLFFAIRGGGGNFGIVTHFVFHAHELSDVVYGTAPVAPDQLGAALRSIRDAMRSAPRELEVTFIRSGPMGPNPAPPPMIEVLWAGADEAAARSALAPVFASPGVGDADLSVMPYGATLKDPPGGPPGAAPPRQTASNGVYRELSDAVIDRVAAMMADRPDATVDIRFLGGALGDVAPEVTALAWRDAEALVHWMEMLPPGSSDDEVAAAYARWEPVLADADAVVGTFTQRVSPELIPRMYPPDTLSRLREIKRDWDPGNLFRRNHNIVPV